MTMKTSNVSEHIDNSESFFLNAGELKHHVVRLGSIGKGRSRWGEAQMLRARESGALWVDTEAYRSGKGLFPFEHELARRIYLGIEGKYPRGLNRTVRFYSVGETLFRKNKSKRLQVHRVQTVNANLTRKLIADAVNELTSQTGILLNQPQIISILESTGLDKRIEELGEVETEIRSDLANALSRKLIDEDWPTYGDSGSMEAFIMKINAAAEKAGYEVCY
ncbi:MAG: phage head-tail adapter protein [Gammaproteobacteria bacterium]|nr:MAG: phage head-tail adapter protein [Gammaproteobacteria bacterium]